MPVVFVPRPLTVRNPVASAACALEYATKRHTPLLAEGWKEALAWLPPAVAEPFLHICSSIISGFDIGVPSESLATTSLCPPNKKLSTEDKAIIAGYLFVEHKAGRISFGLTREQVEAVLGHFQTSPIGLVPRSDSEPASN